MYYINATIQRKRAESTLHWKLILDYFVLGNGIETVYCERSI